MDSWLSEWIDEAMTGPLQELPEDWKFSEDLLVPDQQGTFCESPSNAFSFLDASQTPSTDPESSNTQIMSPSPKSNRIIGTNEKVGQNKVDLMGTSNRKRKRNRFDVPKREKVAKVRKLGACFPCRIRKIPVSTSCSLSKKSGC